MGLFDEIEAKYQAQAQPQAPVHGMPPGWQPDATPQPSRGLALGSRIFGKGSWGEKLFDAPPLDPKLPPPSNLSHGATVMDAAFQGTGGVVDALAHGVANQTLPGIMTQAILPPELKQTIGDAYTRNFGTRGIEPQTPAGYIARDAGKAIGETAPITAAMLASGGLVPAHLISQPSMASTTVGRLGDTVLRGIAGNPRATALADVTAAGASGGAGAGYELAGGTDPLVKSLIEIGSGTPLAIGATLTPGALAARGALMPLTRGGRERIREGVTDLVDTGKQAGAALGRRLGIPDPEAQAKAAITANSAQPGVEEEIARVSKLGDVIPGFQPFLAQREGTQAQIANHEAVQSRLSGDDLNKAVALHDQNKGAILGRIKAGPDASMPNTGRDGQAAPPPSWWDEKNMGPWEAAAYPPPPRRWTDPKGEFEAENLRIHPGDSTGRIGPEPGQPRTADEWYQQVARARGDSPPNPAQPSTYTGVGNEASPEQMASKFTDFVSGIDAKRAAPGVAAKGQIDTVEVGLPTRASDKPGPTYDPAQGGDTLRGQSTALEALDQQYFRERYAQVDPQKRFTMPVEDQRARVQADVDERGNAFTGRAEVPQRVDKMLQGEPSPILGADGAPAQRFATFEDFQRHRAGLLSDIRDAESIANPKKVTTEQLGILKAARQRLDESFLEWADKTDPELAKRFRAVSDEFRDDFVPRYKQGVPGEMGRVDKTGADRLADENIPKKFFGSIREAENFQRTLGGDPRSVQVMTDHALAEIRDSAKGQLTQAHIDQWKAKNSPVLNKMPDVKKAVDALDLASFEAAIAKSQARREQLAKNDLIKRLGDPEKTMDTAIEDPRAMRLLRRSVRGDRDAEGALAQLAWRRVAGTGDELPNFQRMSEILDNEKSAAALRLALSPKAVADLKAIRDAVQVQGRVSRPGGKAEDLDKGVLSAFEQNAGMSVRTLFASGTSMLRGRTGASSEVPMLFSRYLAHSTSTKADAMRRQMLWDGRLREDVADVTAGRMKPEAFRRLHSYLLTVNSDADKKE